MIKAVVFDLDGVYFTADSFSRFKQSLKIDNFPDDLMTLFKKGELTEDFFWDRVRSQFSLKLSNLEISQLLANSYQINPKVASIVKKVRSFGLKTCICTNNFSTRINALNQKFNFLTDFDVQVFSYDVGFVKPDPGIYQELIKQSGCLPSEIVYADDKETNVKSAKELGINSFIYTDFSAFLSELRHLGLDI